MWEHPGILWPRFKRGKLYSKYTDTLLSLAYQALGLKSIVLDERADAADVEAYAQDYSFVADAKAFRLSRTAKNQKDFKVQAMDGWKRGKQYAMSHQEALKELIRAHKIEAKIKTIKAISDNGLFTVK